MAKIVSLVIKAGALAFIFFVPLQYALWLQLAGRRVDQPDVAGRGIGLYTRFFNGWALLLGWVVRLRAGTWLVMQNNLAPVYPLKLLGTGVPLLHRADRAGGEPGGGGGAVAGVQRGRVGQT